jgi:uncharacterized protein YaiI (UPF0178 family)
MKIYIDGDALPNLLKPIISKSIQRLQINTIVVSNKKISIGKSFDKDLVKYIIVEQGADEADNLIVELVEKDDFVITADIPLADRVLSKEAYAIDHRGELYTSENIKHLLAMRNLMQEIRDSGEMTKGPSAFCQKDVGNFANNLNAFFQKYYIKVTKGHF